MKINLCTRCDEPIDKSYGTHKCRECGEVVCAEFCIPSGASTKCLDCEAQDEEDDY